MAFLINDPLGAYSHSEKEWVFFVAASYLFLFFEETSLDCIRRRGGNKPCDKALGHFCEHFLRHAKGIK